jgi:hypothetical protein
MPRGICQVRDIRPNLGAAYFRPMSPIITAAMPATAATIEAPNVH